MPETKRKGDTEDDSEMSCVVCELPVPLSLPTNMTFTSLLPAGRPFYLFLADLAVDWLWIGDLLLRRRDGAENWEGMERDQGMGASNRHHRI